MGQIGHVVVAVQTTEGAPETRKSRRGRPQGFRNWPSPWCDTLAPHRDTEEPGRGATAVSRPGTNHLSEPVNGVTGTSVTLTTPGGASVPATVTYGATTRVATHNPPRAWTRTPSTR